MLTPDLLRYQSVQTEAEKYLRQERNVSTTLEWMGKHPFAVSSLIQNIDLFTIFISVRSNNSNSWRYIPQLQEELGKETLPTMSSFFEDGNSESISVAHVLLRGLRQDVSENTDSEARIVRALFQGYGELVAEVGFAEDIVYALLEAAASHKKSPVFDAVANPHRGNWIIGSSHLSDALRKEVSKMKFAKHPVFPFEPVKKLESAWSPAYLYQKLHEAVGMRKAKHPIPELKTLRAQVDLWYGHKNVDMWIGKYRPEYPSLSRANGKDWSWLKAS